MSGSETISPTAHYTGYVWYRNGLSHPALETTQGRFLFESMQPANLLSRTLGGPTLERYLLARHKAIDALLTHAIERNGVTQVIEVAAGLSPRGWRFANRHGDRITYVEADLPGMAGRKQRALGRMGTLGPSHRVVELDALKDDGPGSLAELIGSLERDGGAAIITEGLLGYLPSEAVRQLWRRFAVALREFAGGGVYLSDLHLAGVQHPIVHGFRVLLSAFVRGQVHLHFDDAGAAEAGLEAAGFDAAEVAPALDILEREGVRVPRDAGSGLAHILRATVRP